MTGSIHSIHSIRSIHSIHSIHIDHFDHFDHFDNFDNFDNVKRTSYIEIPHLSGFSVSLIFRFPRLFYLSNSREIRFVDKEEPRFDSLFVLRIRSNSS